jgi:hypothetical protein
MRSAKHAPSTENDSNRGQGKSLIYSNKSLAYVGSIVKRWDTSDFFSMNKTDIRFCIVKIVQRFRGMPEAAHSLNINLEIF